MKNSSQACLLYKRNLFGEVYLEPHFVLWVMKVWDFLEHNYLVECGSINRIQDLKKSTTAQVLLTRPVLRCCPLASYVPLTALGSANVPAL